MLGAVYGLLRDFYEFKDVPTKLAGAILINADPLGIADAIDGGTYFGC